MEAKINPGSTRGPMTCGGRGLMFVRMRNPRITPNLLVGIALSAVFSLAIAQGIDLGRLIFGAGPASPWAIAGSIAGLIACSFSARYGLRHLRCHAAC